MTLQKSSVCRTNRAHQDKNLDLTSRSRRCYRRDHFRPGNRGLCQYCRRRKQYKLVHYYRKIDKSGEKRRQVDIDQWDLLDRKKDPLEMQSYIDDPAYRAIQANLKQRLTDLRTKLKVVDD